MSLPCYPQYKPSGVKWLGDVPEHWTVTPLKHIADFINGDAFKPAEWAESGIPIIRIQNLNGGEDFNYFDGEVEQRYLVHDGDLLFGWSGNRGTSFGPFLWRRKEVCALNQHIFRVVPKDTDKHLLYWTLKAVTSHVEDQAHGIIGMVHVTKGDLGVINVPTAPVVEQKAIAEFLDRETAKIDGLMGEQRRLIELLKEKRQAVISHAVTRGLNPDAPLKPSGIEWLGDVPEHWQVMPIRRTISVPLANGIFKKKEEFGDGVLLVNVFDIYRGDFKIDYQSLDRVRCTASETTAYEVIPGDLFFVRSSLKQEGIAAVAMATACSEPVVYECHLIRARPIHETLDSHFGSFVLNSIIYRSAMIVKAKVTTMTTIDQEAILSTYLPIPPLLEQNHIADVLDRETAMLDTLTAEAERAIDLLQERRSALISAAVTGQIDVRAVRPSPHARGLH